MLWEAEFEAAGEAFEAGAELGADGGFLVELIRWTARRRDHIAACRAELEHEYVTAVDDDGTPRFLPVVSERARAKLNRIAAKMTLAEAEGPAPRQAA